MPKLHAPLVSFEAIGSLARTIAFKRRHAQNIAEKIPQPKDAQTANQLSWRTMYQACASLWGDLSPIEQSAWESLARSKHMTGFALWQSQCLRPNPGIYLPLAGGTMQGAIDMNSKAIQNLPDPTAAQDPTTKAYVDAFKHDRKHAITSADDHTSSATSGKILKADASGLPVDATNTDDEVKDAVNKKHSQLCEAADFTKLDGIEAGADVTANHDPKAHQSSHLWLASDQLDLASILNQTLNIAIDFQTIAMWTQTNTGSASQSIDIVACDLLTGTTNGSIARLRNTGAYTVIMRASNALHRYSLKNWGITQTVSSIWLAIFRDVTAPSTTSEHIGFLITNGRIYASSCDSASNSRQTDTGDVDMNSLAWKGKRLTIFWVDSDTAKFYIGNTLVATHTDCLPRFAEGRIILQISNSAATNQCIRFMALVYSGTVHWG